MFNLIRLQFGLPLFFIGVSLPILENPIWYFIGCFLALTGSFIISRGMKSDMDGIGFALIGFPLFFYSMSETSYQWLTFVDPPAIILIRISMVFVAGILAFKSFKND